jgi:uncharacterized protein (DUF488 family)
MKVEDMEDMEDNEIRAAPGTGYFIPEDKQEAIVLELFRRKVTRKQLAREMKLSDTALGKILLGRTTCPKRHRKFLSERLGVKL